MALNNKTCKVSFPDHNIKIKAEFGDNLLSLIQMQNIPIAANCGGVGKCGKCIVEINGVRKLACKTHITEDCEVIVPTQNASSYEILTDFSKSNIESFETDLCKDSRFVIAVDIGTTTVVIKMLSTADASEIATNAFVNPQIKFGADVISRINNAMDDAEKLSSLIRDKIDSSIGSMLTEKNIDSSMVECLIIAGNTAMSYILLNLPCRSLGLAPFEPKFIIKSEYEYKEVFLKDTLSCKCNIMPFMSAYVGGDITSGLISLSNEDDFLLIDMGTNGELAYKSSNRLICTSTAAGPAFEGVNISCGMGSTEGAISKIWIENDAFNYQTIGAAPPIGICGSGILDLVACLVNEEIVDETGAFNDDSQYLCDEGVVVAQNIDTGEDIVFTQKDVREFQLAKSAVRSGIEILIDQMDGIIPDKVLLAGGFGQNMSVQSAFDVGLLPHTLSGKVGTAGNTSLAGAIKVALKPELLEDASSLADSCEEINLATHPDFNDMFMDNIGFEKWI